MQNPEAPSQLFSGESSEDLCHRCRLVLWHAGLLKEEEGVSPYGSVPVGGWYR